MKKRRILFSDNLRPFVDVRSEFLEAEGFDVIKAYTLQEAENHLEKSHIHLAILDIRMVDDNDNHDMSGISLAKDPRFKSIPKIILTGFPTADNVREVLGFVAGAPPAAVNFLKKDEGPEAMVDAVKQAFADHVRLNLELEIVWDLGGLLSFPYLTLLIEHDLNCEVFPNQIGEIEDLFRKLFYVFEQISIMQLFWAKQGKICLEVVTYSGENFERRVVTCGQADQVNLEFTLYNQPAEKGPVGIPQAVLAETANYAAFFHSISPQESELFQSGTQFYREMPQKSMQAALENLFQTTLVRWHRQEHTIQQEGDLAQVYQERLDFAPETLPIETLRPRIESLGNLALSKKLIKALSFEGNKLTLQFTNEVTVVTPDPLLYLYRKQDLPKQQIFWGTTLGGSSLDTVLIKSDGQCFPTDFSRVGIAPLHQDFVSLEAELHYHLLETDNLITLYDFEKQLAAVKNLNDAIPSGNVQLECRKALGVIQTIRHLAAQVTSEDPLPYLIGLYFYSIQDLLAFSSTMLYTKSAIAEYVLRLLVASLLCERISRPQEPVVSTAGATQSGGLQIDEAKHEVLLDGKKTELTKTEFKLLLYLSQHASQLCKRADILREVFNSSDPDSQSEGGLLNTHIDRLRRKIEAFPEEPRYLQTVRGEGYKLLLKPK